MGNWDPSMGVSFARVARFRLVKGEAKGKPSILPVAPFPPTKRQTYVAWPAKVQEVAVSPFKEADST